MKVRSAGKSDFASLRRARCEPRTDFGRVGETALRCEEPKR